MFSFFNKKIESGSADVLANRLKGLKFSTNLPPDLIEDIKQVIAEKISAYYRINKDTITVQPSATGENEFEVFFSVEQK